MKNPFDFNNNGKLDLVIRYRMMTKMLKVKSLMNIITGQNMIMRNITILHMMSAIATRMIIITI